MMDELNKTVEELEKNWKIFAEIQYQKWAQVFEDLHLIQECLTEKQTTTYARIYDTADEMLSMWCEIVFEKREETDA
tara:strand:+ start:337 stop:567 length:231 start_codon:yes stop_codon:yes gene_type:complete